MGAPEWTTDSRSDGETLIEIGGRLCYKAFGTELNANLTQVRNGNFDYIGNILKQKHGSVLEHSSVTFVLMGVSRVLTHELVRHRAGVGLSQESMRFVRIDDLPFTDISTYETFKELAPYASPGGSAEDDTSWAYDMTDHWREAVQDVTGIVERHINKFTRYLDDPNKKVPFAIKKKITSLLRRLAPHGTATNIMVTANHRAWRHMLAARVSGGAEEEIRDVFWYIGMQLKSRYTALYQDMIFIEEPRSIEFKHEKV